MKSLLVVGAAALMVVGLAGEASAQKFGGRGGGGGFSRGAIGGGGFARGSFGGGFNRAAIGGSRAAFVGGRGFAGRGFAGRGWAGRSVAWSGNRWHGGRFWRRGIGWGVPVAAAGLAFAAASTYPYYDDYPSYSDSCTRWNGYTWVNVCYSSYSYGYGPAPYVGFGGGPFYRW